MENWKAYKKAFLMGIFFSFGIVVSAVVAVTVSATFTSGDTLTAANMNVLKAAIESIPDWTKSGSDAVYTAGNVQVGNGTTSRDLLVYGKVSSSALGTFCGVTASTYDGAGVGGYTGAKTKCETACSDTRAHMCTSHEIAISAQLGNTFPENTWYWFSAGAWGYVGVANVAGDCMGWSEINSGYYGQSVARLSDVYQFDKAPCSNARRIACCR
jgi:hypothetical protein